MNFEGKSLFFIGDSITANGSFVSLLRGYFRKNSRKISVFNKGIPGASAAIAYEALGEALSVFTPDIGVISLGVNDVGYWEYTSSPELTSDERRTKQERQDLFIRGIARLADALAEKGVCSIICSPFCVSRFLSGVKEIETEVDSREKNSIKSSFYTREAFAKINDSLGEYAGLLRKYAEARGFEFWDLFSETFCGVNEDCFRADGIHYSAAGDKLIADLIARKISGNACSAYEASAELEKIAELEAAERAYYFVKYNIMRNTSVGLSDSELLDAVSVWLKKNGNINGLNEAREAGFFKFVIGNREKQRKLTELILGEKI